MTRQKYKSKNKFLPSYRLGNIGKFVLLCSLFTTLNPNISIAQTIAEAVKLSLENSASLSAAKERIKGVTELKIQAENLRRPTISLDANAGLVTTGAWTTSFFGENTFDKTKSRPANIGVSATQPLFTGGQYKANMLDARLKYDQSMAQLRAQQLALIKDVITAYADVLRDNAIYLLRLESVANLEQQLKATEAEKNVGAIGLTDVAQIKTRVAAIKAQSMVSRANLMSSWSKLRRYIGTDELELTQDGMDIYLPNDIDGAIDFALLNNSDLEYVRYNQDIAKANEKKLKAEAAPKLSLALGTYGNLDRDYVGSKSIETQVNLKLNMPIWTGGLLSSRLRGAQYEAKAAQYEAKDIESQLKQLIVSAWEYYETAIENQKLAQAQIDAAKIAKTGTELERKFGSRTTFDVLNQEQEVLDAKVNLVVARHDALVAGSNILIYMGKDPTNILDELFIDVKTKGQFTSNKVSFSIPSLWERPFVSIHDALLPIDEMLTKVSNNIFNALGNDR